MMKVFDVRWAAVACLALAFLFTGCPTEVEVEPESDVGRLTITGFVGNIPTHRVYVFPQAINLNGLVAVNNAVTANHNLALGFIVGGGHNNVFAMTGRTGLAQAGEVWTGTGTFNVIIINTIGEQANAVNPMFRRATVSFANGSATVAIGDFVPVVN